jgi:4-hydroxy-tetrahydrodipicolinate reductase
MGQRLVAFAKADPELELVSAVDAAGHPRLGEDAGLVAGVGAVGVKLTAALEAPADVVVDFSTPKAVDSIIQRCVQDRIALVAATTGLEQGQIERLREAGRQIPVVWSPSMSLAVNLSMKLSEVAARALADKNADVEIVERHHRFKEDAPSGTALKFGQIIADVMGQTVHRHGRQGRPGARPPAEIGYHAIRVGDNPGEHTIIFAMLGESIELTVRATNRDCYAQGALAAAKYVVHQPPGLYGMNDVLGLG